MGFARSPQAQLDVDRLMDLADEALWTADEEYARSLGIEGMLGGCPVPAAHFTTCTGDPPDVERNLLGGGAYLIRKLLPGGEAAVLGAVVSNPCATRRWVDDLARVIQEGMSATNGTAG